jgi:signal transduction histidine kinase
VTRSAISRSDSPLSGVRSVVDNLVENAVEHDDADDPRVHVAVGPGVDTVRLRVLDDGPGIADERQARMFDDGDSLEGGLRLVEALVDGYDGTVCVEDNEPRGTVFVVELEAADVAPGGSGR